MFICLCGSGLPYDQCCGALHKGRWAPDALALMRSRYVAYALDIAEYIIETTHPKNPVYKNEKKMWMEQVHKFSRDSIFERLEIVDFQEFGNRATVTFIAYLRQNNRSVPLKEKSLFEKVQGRWLYLERMKEGN